jgi:hypothetical protein
MTTEQDSADPYDIVLADLKAKRAEIDQAIKAIERLRGVRSAAGDTPPAASVPLQNGSEIEPGAFHGMSIPEAARKLLTIKKRQLSNADLVAGFKAGGLILQSENWANTVGSVLNRRFAQVGDIVRVGRGMWGLREWNPNIRYRPNKEQDGGDESDASGDKDEIEKMAG